MSFYPVNLNLANKRCAVVGGGKIAWRKVITLLKAQALITVISPIICQPLMQLVEKEKIIYHAKSYCLGDLHDFFLVVCATNSSDVNKSAAIEAKEHNSLVNVVDDSFPSDFTVPAQVRQGDLLLTVSTNGKSPAFTRLLKEQLAEIYNENYAKFLQMISVLRIELKEQITDSKEREMIWQQIMTKEIFAFIEQGKLNEVEAKIKNAISCFRVKS